MNFAGDYDGGLGNSGDSFSLEVSGGEVLWTLTYGDAAPWPSGVDGEGRSLIYVGGTASEPGSWRPSVTLGGNPGTSDRVPFLEGGNLAEYAIDKQEVRLVGPLMVSFEVLINSGADDASLTPVWSSDLEAWSDEGFTLISQDPVGNGMLRQRWQMAREPNAGRLFFRMNLERRREFEI